MRRRAFIITALCLASTVGCREGDDNTSAGAAGQPPQTTQPTSNRIDLPEKVRQNLGITFAKAERRRVAATLRAPGRFEPLPSARREYRTGLNGAVELLVGQYDPVQPGTSLYRIRSPEWQKMREQLAADQAAAKKGEAEVAAAEAAKIEAQKSVELLERRIAELAEAKSRRPELEIQLAAARNSLPRLEAEATARRADLEAARQRLPLTLSSGAAMAGLTVEQLTEQVDTKDGPAPRWRTLEAVEVKAAEQGLVEALGVTNGSWVETSGLVLSTINPKALRFRATALQSDLARLKPGAAASVAAPRTAGRDPNAAIPGKLSLGLEASPETRSVDLIVTPNDPANLPVWARPGVSAYAEIVTDDSVEPETAIPVACVVQDELAKVYFRRDPKDPDKVIRVEGDFGVSDGKWIAVQSGLRTGDEVVLDGVYELKLTGSGKAQGGGHFHADGTWHPAGTPEPGSKK